MTIIPPASLAALMSGQPIKVWRWLEIEGLPYALGTFARDASWFEPESFLGVARLDRMVAALAGVPRGPSQELDPLEGGNISAASLEFDVVDVDGLVTSLLNLSPAAGALTAEVSKTSTAPLVAGIAPAFGDLLYVGTETWRVTGTSPLQVRRAVCGSEAQEFGAGFPVGTRPYTMANRRVRLYQSITTGDEQPTDAGKWLRYQGIARGLTLGTNRATYKLRVDSLDMELNTVAFDGGAQLTSKPWAGYSWQPPGHADRPGAEDDDGWLDPDSRQSVAEVTDDLSEWFSDGERAVFRIGDEHVAATVHLSGDSQWLDFAARGLGGSEKVSHEAPWTAEEVLAVAAHDVMDPTWLGWASRFSEGGPVFPDHPLAILLQLMMSTGDGTNSAAETGVPGGPYNYDVLPGRWGMSVAASRINISEIERVMLEEPHLRFRGLVSGGTNFVAFARELLRFGGYYFFVDGGGRFCVRKLRPPMPDTESLMELGPAALISGNAPTFDSNWSHAVETLTFKYGWDGSAFRNVAVVRIPDAAIYAKGMARTLTIESKLVAPSLGWQFGGGGGVASWDVDSWLLQRQDFFRMRYGRPLPLVVARTDYRGLRLSIGDIVTLSNVSLPNIAGGTRGVSVVQCEVVGLQTDEASHTVEVSLLVTDYGSEYRYYPLCTVLEAGDIENPGKDEWHVHFSAFERLYADELFADGVFMTMGFAGPSSIRDPSSVGLYELYTADWQHVATLACTLSGDESSLVFETSETLAAGMVLVPSYAGASPLGEAARLWGYHADDSIYVIDLATRLFPL